MAPHSWFPDKGCFHRVDTVRVRQNLRLMPPSNQFGLLVPINQQEKKAVTVLVQVIDPELHEEKRLTLCKRKKEK